MEQALDPTLGAILPLIGVALGVMLAGGAEAVRRWVDQRADLREAKTVAP